MDPLKISADLSALAEAPASRGAVDVRFAVYLRDLLNAVAVLVYEPGPGAKAVLLDQAWGEGAERAPERARQVQGIVEARLGSSDALIQEMPGDSGLKTFILCVPVVREGRVKACLAAVLAAQSREALSPFVVILQAAAGTLSYRFERRERSELSWALDQITALMEILSLAAACEDFPKGARTLADALARHLGCQRACIGVQKRGAVSLAAVSGSEAFDKRGTTALALEAAMREALLRRETVVWPREGGVGDAGDAAHHELGRLLDVERVVTVPLQDAEGRHEAAVSFLWPRGAGPDAKTLRFIASARPHLGAQVSLLRRASPGFLERARRRAWVRLGQDARRAVLAAAAALLLLMAWPFSHRIRASTRIQPDVKRVVAAPFDGILKRSFVDPGQAVDAGALLARMDDKELAWKQAELIAVRDRASTQRDQTLADQSVEYAVSRMADFDSESVGLELAAIEEKIKNLELRAPIPGVVLLGDLRKYEGIPVAKGQVLFEVAPLDRMRAELEIDSDDISHVSAGMPVSLRLDSLPGRTWRGRLERIDPQSEARGGSSVFVAEASLLDAEGDASLRPGMKGRASIFGRRRPLFWILFHRLWEVLGLLLFW
ncbi:MAG TPA: hypothetical protein DCM05_12305 [Elusimicrobia bacterium]|nr:hypothetical protein [Elusimicrobiota bacterium]